MLFDRLLLHAKYVADTYPECPTVLQSPDRDVLALSIYQLDWILVQNWHYDVLQELGEKMCPPFGLRCHYWMPPTRALAGISKKKGCQVLLQHQDSPGLLGEAFISDLYPSSRMKPHTVDELRYSCFLKTESRRTSFSHPHLTTANSCLLIVAHLLLVTFENTWPITWHT